MLPPIPQLRAHLRAVVADKEKQGRVIDGLAARLDALPESYDAMNTFAQELARLPLRPDWPYVEPNDWAGITAELSPERPRGVLRELSAGDAAARVEAAFLGRVSGCILGKPVEPVNARLDLADLRAAAEPLGEWPLSDYVSTALLQNLGRPHPSWPETVRERISYVAPDDDINYTLLGMLALEQHGKDFTRQDLLRLWFKNLPAGVTWGPERTVLMKLVQHTLPFAEPHISDSTLERWVSELNPHDEFCGAMIRADAYGYSCPGNPGLAAELAWRDAGLTHRGTGVYATMWAAAAVATAFVARDPVEIFAVAQQFVPQRSRFHAVVSDSLDQVTAASDWLDGYQRIHGSYGEYGHCHVYQEAGTLINTLRFATDVGDGICKQVMQGNDTDSFGATAGSLLGAYYGPGHLEERWLIPFRDDVRTKLAGFPERSLTALTARVGQLPERMLSPEPRAARPQQLPAPRAEGRAHAAPERAPQR